MDFRADGFTFQGSVEVYFISCFSRNPESSFSFSAVILVKMSKAGVDKHTEPLVSFPPPLQSW